jgi:hypothetical protein
MAGQGRAETVGYYYLFRVNTKALEKSGKARVWIGGCSEWRKAEMGWWEGQPLRQRRRIKREWRRERMKTVCGMESKGWLEGEAEETARDAKVSDFRSESKRDQPNSQSRVLLEQENKAGRLSNKVPHIDQYNLHFYSIIYI